jgi:hypothetical protein
MLGVEQVQALRDSNKKAREPEIYPEIEAGQEHALPTNARGGFRSTFLAFD